VGLYRFALWVVCSSRTSDNTKEGCKIRASVAGLVASFIVVAMGVLDAADLISRSRTQS